MPQVIITAGAARGLESCRRFLAEKSPEAARRAGQAISRQFRLLQDAPAIGRPLPEEPDCGSWSSALGIPAMWRCTATSRMRVPFTYWPSGTRKKPGIERDHGSVLTPPDDAGGAAATAGVPKMRPPGNSSRPDAQVLSGNHPKRVRNLSKPGVRQFSCHNS